MGWNKNNRPEPQAATSADDSRKTATSLPCGKCGVWVPVAMLNDHAPCNGKMIDPRSIKR